MPHLSSISEIRMGATLRGRDATRPDPKGSYRFVRIGDISQDGRFDNTDFLRIEPNEPVSAELCLRPGDVLFPNRGTRTTAIAYRFDEPRTIVGSQFFIVRADTTLLLPEFLAWFLRTDESCRHFESRRKGSHVQTVQRQDLAELEIPLPPVETQRKIVQAADLAAVERQLTERLLDLRRQLIGGKLLKAATNSPQPKKSRS
ncbi:MAG: restriction endonuclease subunit S [Verrucomicrobiota bacterium]